MWGGLLAMLLAGSPLFAQNGVTVDVGAAAMRFPADGQVLAGPWLRASARRDTAGRRTSASASVLASGTEAAGVVEGDAWWRRRLGGAFSGDAGGEAGALYASGLEASASALAAGRLDAAVGAFGGLWLRGSIHGARREAGMLRGRGLEAGGWWRGPLATVTASILAQRAQGQLFADTERRVPLGVVPVRYAEARIGVAHEADWGTLGVMGGARRDPDATQRTEALWTLSALVWSASRVALTASASALPDDFVHGADAARTFSIGLRFGARRAGPAEVPHGRATAQVVDLSPDAPRRLRVHAPHARTVELMADFTQWETVALAPAGPDFILPAELPRGLHRVMVRIDGGPWLPPSNLPSMDDDLGGRVGVLVVP